MSSPASSSGRWSALASLGLLDRQRRPQLWRRPAPTSEAAMQLSLLAQATIQTIERYYLAIACWCGLAATRSRRRCSKSAASSWRSA
jgi:hypothetical protein